MNWVKFSKLVVLNNLTVLHKTEKHQTAFHDFVLKNIDEFDVCDVSVLLSNAELTEEFINHHRAYFLTIYNKIKDFDINAFGICDRLRIAILIELINLILKKEYEQ